MPEYVLDNSVTMTWFFPDEKREDCEMLFEELAAASRALVPAHWAAEVANSLIVGERRKRSVAEATTDFIGTLETLQIVEDSMTRKQAFAGAMSLAREHGLTVYDALYLELAQRAGVTLASLDSQLRTAATKIGVPCFPPR